MKYRDSYHVERFKNKGLSSFQKILVFVIMFIVFTILVGTFFVLLMNSNKKKSEKPGDRIEIEKFDESKIYTKLGQIRAVTGDDIPVTVIISPCFPYPEDDSAFCEELYQKNRKLKSVVVNYFAYKTQAYLLSAGEEIVKEELIEVLNRELVLGGISKLYLKEYIFLD